MKNLIQTEKGSKIDESSRLLCQPTAPGATSYALLEAGSLGEDVEHLEDSNQTGDIQWRLGLFLAVVSGLLFTANNFLIQYFRIEALEILLVRSVVQSVVLGLTSVSLSEWTSTDGSPREPVSRSVKVFVVLQALVGAIRLYLNFSCLAFLPLGDALTIIFTEPLFTMVFSCMAFRYRVSLCQIFLAFGLLSGMVMCIQPPILFNK